jgi:hypothetical protein
MSDRGVEYVGQRLEAAINSLEDAHSQLVYASAGLARIERFGDAARLAEYVADVARMLDVLTPFLKELKESMKRRDEHE